jgi:LmbE family N-acetylglucosaminyl deacetylase
VDTPLRLMAILAHPDDESLGVGGTLARYAAESVDVHLVTATRGERGRFFSDQPRPSDEAVGRVREGELRAAATVLGIRDVQLLGYRDLELDQASPSDVIALLVKHIRRIRPQVVVTFDPFGAYGHPDHIAISQLTTAAVAAAADPTEMSGEPADRPHRVSKLYFMAWTATLWDAYQQAFKRLVSRVDGVERQATPWPDWSVTTRIDTREHWNVVWRAVHCHRTQIDVYRRLHELAPNHHEALWGTQTFYRVFSSVNGGREMETDLFAGLR